MATGGMAEIYLSRATGIEQFQKLVVIQRLLPAALGGRPRQFVNRRLSPLNVIVTYDGGVQLVDFGLVKAEGRITESRSGSLKGKLADMSPEQARAKSCDRRSDLFSLSIMLWELT